jgi:phosphoribosylformimino-5-aminoimidazole carboxamide ribotide isomerase
MGVRHFLCTAIDRDGTLRGPDVALYADLQERFPEAEIQVSGGIGKISDLQALKECGLRAAILGKSLYEGKILLEEALKC